MGRPSAPGVLPRPMPGSRGCRSTDSGTCRCRSPYPATPIPYSMSTPRVPLSGGAPSVPSLFKRTNYYMLICIYDINQLKLRLTLSTPQLFISVPSATTIPSEIPLPALQTPPGPPFQKGGIIHLKNSGSYKKESSPRGSILLLFNLLEYYPSFFLIMLIKLACWTVESKEIVAKNKRVRRGLALPSRRLTPRQHNIPFPHLLGKLLPQT